MSTPEVRWLTCVLASLLCGCGEVTLRLNTELPAQTPLDTLSVVDFGERFSVSSAYGMQSCGAVLVGGAAGTLVKLQADGELHRTTGRVPGDRSAARFSPVSDSVLLVRVNTPPLLGYLSLSDWSFDSIPVPEHPWVGHRAGPAVAVGSDQVAYSPTSTASVFRSDSTSDLGGAIVLVGRDGEAPRQLSRIERRAGVFLTAYLERRALGSLADTLRVVRYSDAVLESYLVASSRAPEPLGTVALPRYFDRPVPAEGIAEVPLLPPGEQQVPWFIGVRQLHRATFAPNGLLYAVRNYEARLRERTNRLGQRQEWWEVSRRGLEVYRPDGTLVAAHDVPVRVDWLRVDHSGRIFMPGAERGTVVVLQDPRDESRPCATTWPRTVKVDVEDLPAAGDGDMPSDSHRHW